MKYFVTLLIFASWLFAGVNPLKKATLALSEGDYKAALEFVEEAQKLDKQNPEVYRMKGLLHETLDQPEKALLAWKKCLKLSNNEYLSTEAKVHIQNLEGDH